MYKLLAMEEYDKMASATWKIKYECKTDYGRRGRSAINGIPCLMFIRNMVPWGIASQQELSVFTFNDVCIFIILYQYLTIELLILPPWNRIVIACQILPLWTICI